MYLVFWNSGRVFLLVLFLEMEGTCNWNHVLYPSFCLSVIKKFITECPPTVSAIFLSSFCFTLLYNVGVKLV